MYCFMVRKICLLFCLLFVTLLLHAQSTFKKNDIYLEAGGHGLFGSVNYERQLTRSPGLGVRIGLGFYAENAFYLTIPAGINYLFKLPGKNSFIDAGIGGSWTKLDGRLFGDTQDALEENIFNFIPSIGYRRHTAKDMMWRINFTPVFNEYVFLPWVGLSIGKRF
jgi:hypothetical protein